MVCPHIPRISFLCTQDRELKVCSVKSDLVLLMASDGWQNFIACKWLHDTLWMKSTIFSLQVLHMYVGLWSSPTMTHSLCVRLQVYFIIKWLWTVTDYTLKMASQQSSWVSIYSNEEWYMYNEIYNQLNVHTCNDIGSLISSKLHFIGRSDFLRAT